MTLPELVQVLKATGFPVAYSHFSATPSIPFITYTEIGSNNFHADNKTYQQIRRVHIELYTDKKDLQAEATLEALLEAHELAYETSEAYIDSEQLFQKVYEIEVV
ncbi:hypothetical protein [Staphylospora marina]|uniref:hypothetical protein n=1 Tax=Staphylospora marina TaxID=2490858 RepID=UPI000F5BC9B0|nr:hypothetical protein [Staphylospora marina]